jgi:tetratricopeptide (TPR) repeat protein
LGPLSAEHLSLSFVGLKFPLDLSGGVPAFRHRRGNLERVVLQTDLERLRKWFEPRLRSTGEPLVRPLDLWWIEGGLAVGIAREASALCWELHWAPLLGQARWVVANARGWGLSAPALAEALRATDTILGKLFTRSGRVLSLEDAGTRLGRHLLPLVGARAPSAKGVVFGSLQVQERTATVVLDATNGPASLGVDTTRWLELADLARSGDDALALGELDEARHAYLAALEAAPRQRELVMILAELDLLTGRTEAAMGLLSEAIPILSAGAIGARLLLATEERAAAAELLAQAARDERYAPLAALMHLSRAELEPNGIERRLALDGAVAAAPSLLRARWTRLEARASFGDLQGAMADAQHLEAGSIGRRMRHESCRRAANILLGCGFEIEAGQLFQRALRYGPDDVDAMVGLARSLCATGDALRAIPLLNRAIATADAGGEASGYVLVELARLIATSLHDLPQAIARLRRVVPGDPACGKARAEEARYRFMMGDVIGASLAFSRMRETIELAMAPTNADVEALVEAARFERDVSKDAAAAERHLAIALRFAPRDPKVQAQYREVAAVLAARKARASRGTNDMGG